MAFRELAFSTGGEGKWADAPNNVLTSFGRRERTPRGDPAYFRKTRAGTGVGEQAIASGDQSTAVGAYAFAGDDGATAVGVYSRARGKQSTLVGSQSNASGANSTHVGQGGTSTGINTTTVGQAAVNAGRDSIGVGVAVTVRHNNVIAIGNRLSSTANDQILIATDGNTALRVDGDGAVFVNDNEVGELITPNSAESATNTFAVSATSGEWSSWTEFFSSTAARAVRILLGIVTGTITATGRMEIQLAQGAAASEVDLLDGHTFYIGVDANVQSSANLQVTFDVAAGTRISVRHRQVGGAGASGATSVTVTMLEVV